MFALLTGVSGAWATDVVISDRTNTVATGSVTTTNEHKYGTYSNAAGGTSFTTNATSGMAGVTVTADAEIIRAAYFSGDNYKYVMGFNPSDANAHTITISAPEGYLVTGYSITAISTSANRTFTVTPAGDTSKTATAPGTTAINKTGLNSQTATITIQAANANTGNFLCFPLFSVTVMSATANLVNVTYELYESDGTTLVNTVVKEQEENSAIEIPTSLTAPTYYDYSTEGTIGNSDCTIKVIRTLKSGYVISLDGFSNSKCYNIQNNRGWWAVANGASEINSTGGLSLATSTSDSKQQFAFLHYVDDYDNDNNGNVYGGYYLYSVNVGKFAYVDGTKLSLSTLDAFSSPALSKVTFQSSTSSDYKNTAPTVVTLDGSSFGVHPSQTPKVYKYSPHLGDGGNASAIKEAGAFTPTTAITALKNFLYPTLDSGDTYTFNIYQSDNTTPLYLSLTTSAKSVKYVVTENGTNTEGRTVYSLKNASTGKYLSYTNAGKSSDGNDTRLSWADNATNSKFLFSNAYNGRLAIRPAAASADNYLTAWDIVSDKNVIFWNDANANSKNMSYWTVTKVGHPVTYNLIWNGETIETNTVSSVLTGDESSDYVPWSAPAYCSFSYDVDDIEESTSTVNVTMNWDGPFEISSDFEHANWCYLKMHGQYLIYSGSSATPNSLGDLASAESAASKAFWAFVGDPFNGFQLINKAAGSDKNLAVKWWNPNMDTQETKWLLQSWNSDFALHTSSYFYLNNADGQLKLWVSGTSVEAMNFDCAIESVSYKGLALAFIDDYADSHAVGHYFGVATSTYNSVRAGYADAASVSASDYTQLVSFIGGMLPASYPKTGYYRIKSNSGRYIGYGQPEADPMPSVGLRTVSAEDAAKDASTIIHLVKGVGSHQYTMSTQGKNVQSMVNGNTPFPATSDAGVTFVLEALTTTPGKGTIRNTASNNEDNGYINGYLHEANWTVPGVINWEAGSESSQWSIEDVTSIDVTLRDGGDGYYYTTAYFDFPVSYTGASNGEGLFVLTGGESNGKVTAQKVAAVPAQQGFLIRLAAENVTDSKVTLTIPASAEALTGTNVLTGTCLATTKPDGNVYVFSKVGDDLGFFPYTGSDIPANRAYIVESDGNVRSFILSFDDTTGINGVSTSMPAGTIFDMQGRRVNKAEKGLYIVNGKKVLF